MIYLNPEGKKQIHFFNIIHDNIKPMAATLFISFLMIVLLLFYTGRAMGGNYKYLIMSSSCFGMPEEIAKEMDMPLTYTNGRDLGWDGQFYFYISNDPLGLRGYSANVDSPSYRWQRIGLPLLANLISKLCLQEHVSIPVYYFTNLLLLAAAAFVAFKYLRGKGHSMLWVLPWFFSVGVIITFFNALPDGAADALFIIAFIMLLKDKILCYSLFMSLACLTREGYVLIAFVVFLLGIFGKIDCCKVIHEKKLNTKNFFLMAMPGIIFVIWYAYVSLKFRVMPFKQAYGITQLFMTSWPGYFLRAIKNEMVSECIGLFIYLLFIVLSLLLSLKAGKENAIFYALAPYIVLVGSFGPTVMTHYSGYLKGISILYFILPLMILSLKDIGILTTEKSQTISLKRGLVTLTAVFMAFVSAVSGMLVWDKIDSTFFTTDLQVAGKENPVVQDDVQTLGEFKGEVEVIKNEEKGIANIPFKDFFVRNYSIFTINVKNISNCVWPNTMKADSWGKIAVSYKWYINTTEELDPNSQIIEGSRITFGKNVQPGETVTLSMYVNYPEKAGDYILRISLIQEGCAWFYTYGNGYIDIPITIN